MAFPSLPRSYLVKKARRDLNGEVEIEPLSLPYRGAVRPFKRTLAAALATEVSIHNLQAQR